jgi:hypothetical protein
MIFDPDGLLVRRNSKMESPVTENYVTETFPYPEWQRPCQAALVELDRAKLQERIAAAEAAIVSRLNAASAAPVSAAERQAIADALATLRVLKRECLGSSHAESSE